MNTNNTMFAINNPLPQELPGPGSAHTTSATAPIKHDNCQITEADCHGQKKSFDSILQEQGKPNDEDSVNNSQKNDSADDENIDLTINNQTAKSTDKSDRVTQKNMPNTELGITELSDAEIEQANIKENFIADNTVNETDNDPGNELSPNSDVIRGADIDVDNSNNQILSRPTETSSNVEQPDHIEMGHNQVDKVIDSPDEKVTDTQDTEQENINRPTHHFSTINGLEQNNNHLMSKTMKPEQATVSGNTNIQSIETRSPIAGSLATPSEAIMHSSPTTSSNVKLTDIPSEIFQWSGKTSPLGGNNSPESLPFYSSTGAAIEAKVALGNNALPTTQYSISDLVNKSLSFTQQLNNVEIEPSLLTVNSPSLLADSISAISNNITPAGALSHSGYIDRTTENRPQLPGFPIPAPVASNEWHAQVGNRVTWLGKMNISNAELLLHPAELGAIEVKISTENEQTKVSFISNNAVTREIIEASLPKLRELLSEGGLQLEHSDVSAHSQETASNEAEQNNKQQVEGDVSESAHLADNTLPTMRGIHLGQINHYV